MIRELLLKIGANFKPLEEAEEKALQNLDKMGSKLQSVGKAWTAAISVPLAGAATASIIAFDTIAQGFGKVRTGTGATGAELAKFRASFDKVFSEMPASAEQVGSAIAALAARTGASGAELESLATQALNLAKITGSDVTPLIDATSKAFNSWGVATKDQSSKLDDLFKISQATGVPVQALADQLSKGGANLRAFGVDLDTGAALLGQMGKAGLNSEQALSGLSSAAQKLAQQGGNMATNFRSAFAAIKNSDETTAARKAVELFGEAGVMMAQAIKRGTLDVEQFAAAIGRSPETINRAAADTRTLADRFEVLRNKVTLALEPLGKSLVDAMVNLMPLFTMGANALKVMVDAFAALPVPVQSAAVVLAGVAAAIGPALFAVGALASGVSGAITTMLELRTAAAGVTALGGAWAKVGSAVELGSTAALGAMSNVSGTLAAIGTRVLAFGATLAGLALPIAAAVAAAALLIQNWGAVKAAASALGSTLKAGWDGIRAAAVSSWEGIKSTVISLADAVSAKSSSVAAALASDATSMGAAVWDGVHAGFSKAAAFSAEVWEKMRSTAESTIGWLDAKLDGMLSKAASTARKVAETLAAAAGGAGAGSGANVGGAFDAGRSVAEAFGFGSTTYSGDAFPGPGATSSMGASSGTGYSTSSFGMGGGGSAPLGSASSGSSGVWPGAATANPFTASVNASYGGGSSAYTRPADGRQYYSDTRKYYGDAGYTTGAGTGSVSPFAAAPLSIPKLAQGGIVSSPTIAMIGEAGPEAVVPLSRLGRGGLGGANQVVINVYVTAEGSIAAVRDVAREVRAEMLLDDQRNGDA